LKICFLFYLSIKNSNGTLLAFGNKEGIVFVYDVNSGQEVSKIQGEYPQ
jgi:hypothetical protein